MRLTASSTWKSPGPSLPYNEHLGFTPGQLLTRNGGNHDGHRHDEVHSGGFLVYSRKALPARLNGESIRALPSVKSTAANLAGCNHPIRNRTPPQMACSCGVEVTERRHRRGSLHPPLIAKIKYGRDQPIVSTVAARSRENTSFAFLWSSRRNALPTVPRRKSQYSTP